MKGGSAYEIFYSNLSIFLTQKQLKALVLIAKQSVVTAFLTCPFCPANLKGLSFTVWTYQQGKAKLPFGNVVGQTAKVKRSAGQKKPHQDARPAAL